MISVINKIVHFLNSSDGSLLHKSIRSGFWVGFSSIVINSLSFIRTIILARLLTPEIFGLMSICMIVVRGIEIFTETGIGTAIIHRQKNFEEEKDVAFTLMVFRGFILAIVTFLIAPLIAIYYKESVLDLIIKVFAVSFIFKGFYNINTIHYQIELDFKRLSYLEQATNFINFAIVVTLAYYLRNVWALVIGQVAASLIGTVMSFIIIPGRPRISFNKRIAKELFTYGKFITGLTIILYISTELDNMVIGRVLGVKYLGYYVVAFTLANLPATHISKLISKIMFPAYSKLQNNPIALQDAYLKVLKLVANITIPASVGIAILASEIIKVIYGVKWMPAVGALQILCIFGLIRAIGSLNGYLYNAIGKPNITFYLNVVRFLILLAVIYPLTSKYGIEGTAIAVTFPVLFLYFIEIYILTRVLKLEAIRITKTLLMATCFSLIMALIILYIKSKIMNVDIYALILLIICGMISYALLNFQKIILYFKKTRSSLQI